MASSDSNRRFSDWACPKCGAEVGAPCRSLETGRPVQYPHKGRRSPDPEAWERTRAAMRAEKPKRRDPFSPSDIAPQSWLSVLHRRRKDD